MKKLVLIIAIYSFVGCNKEIAEETDGTAFYFDSPQPVNDSELSSLPTKFRGDYQTGDVRLTITDKVIYHTYHDDGKVAKSELDSLKGTVSYKDNKLVWHEDDKHIVYNAKEEKDSIYYLRERIDTVFRFSERHKAKRINGQLVLSTKDSVFWQVKMLSLEKDSLKWKYFSYKSDYGLLKPVVKDISSNADTTVIRLKPTRREFGKILELKTLKANKYKKIK